MSYLLNAFDLSYHTEGSVRAEYRIHVECNEYPTR